MPSVNVNVHAADMRRQLGTRVHINTSFMWQMENQGGTFTAVNAEIQNFFVAV